MNFVATFRDHLAALDLLPGRAVIAVSGGPDSAALLDLLVKTRDAHGLELIVAHADHGIHPDSSSVAEQVRDLAAGYGLPYELGRLELGPDAGETLARTRRHAWLDEVRVRVGARVILLAHHADDQIETVLMRVLEGSGPAGLAGMAAVAGPLVRPLLPFRRTDLLRHLREAGLIAWVDPANQDPRHLRSWIRTELIPLLERRIPEVKAKVERLASQARGDRSAWDKALEVLPGLELRREGDAISVDVAGLSGYDSALQQAIIRALARQLGCSLGPARLGRVLGLIETRRSGARVPLGAHWFAELAFDRLRVAALPPAPAESPWAMIAASGEGAWGRWRFRWQRETAPAEQDRRSRSAWFTLDPLTVRGWERGEKLKPLGAPGRRLVVRCFQEERVPLSRRPSWPVLAQEKELLWIPGVCRSALRLPPPGIEAIRVDADYA
jgi:tRNA(Ile)-lysidine synthase